MKKLIYLVGLLPLFAFAYAVAPARGWNEPIHTTTAVHETTTSCMPNCHPATTHETTTHETTTHETTTTHSPPPPPAPEPSPPGSSTTAVTGPTVTVTTPGETTTVTTPGKTVTRTVTKTRTVVKWKTRWRTRIVYRKIVKRTCSCPPGERMWKGKCHHKAHGKG